MNLIAEALLPLGLLVALGWLLRRFVLPDAAFWSNLERLLYYVLLPVLLFGALGDMPSLDGQALSLGAVTAGALLCTSLLLVLGRRWLASDGAAFSSVLQGAVRVNVYAGLAVVAAVFGDDGIVMFSLVIAIAIPLDNVISVAGLVLFASAGRPRLFALLGRIVFNPLIVSIVLGLTFAAGGMTLPDPVEAVMDLLGGATLPLALMAVGAGIRFEAAQLHRGPLWLGIAARQLVLPAMALAISLLAGLDGPQRAIVMLHALLPTGPAAYLVARQMGGDAPLMAGIVSGTILFAGLTIPVWLLLFAH